MINHRFYEKDKTISPRFNIQRNWKCFPLTAISCSSWIRLLLLIIYSIFIINFYDYFFIQPDFSSNLLSSSYACHDTPSCTAKLGLLKNQTTISNKNFSKNAFFSALYTENYLIGALILGHTIRKYHPNHPMYMLYFADGLQNETTRCALQLVGWKLMKVERIPPVPGTHKRFLDQVRIVKIFRKEMLTFSNSLQN
jgi:hypothetical protein